MARKSRNRKSGDLTRKAMIIVVLFTVAVAAGLAVGYYRHGYTPMAEVALNASITIKGLSLKDLNLTSNEIGELNRSMSRHAKTFTEMSIEIDKKAAKRVRDNTRLAWSMKLTPRGSGVVKSWPRKCPRKRLVESIVQYVDTAASEYNRLRRSPDMKRGIREIYI